MLKLMKTAVFICSIILLLIALKPAFSLEDGRIGVIYIGCIARSPPFRNMRSDPLFSMSFVQATLRDWAGMPVEDVHRLVRMYMPRTVSALSESYDVIVIANANLLAVGPHVEKLARGVEDEGMGLLMSGGWESFGGTGTAEPAWGETAIGRLLPTNDVVGIWDESGRLVIDKPDHELLSSIPWNLKDPDLANPIRWHHNPVTLKPGAEQLAHVVNKFGVKHPLMVTWERGMGQRVFALTSEIHALCWYGSPWEYCVDFGGNLVIYVDGRPVPQDFVLLHAVRSKMSEIDTRRSLLLSLLDFCESFGANTDRMLRKCAEIDGEIAKCVPQYLDLKLEETLDSYQVVEEMLLEAEDEAVSLKNRTLFWIYTIEWLAVTGVLMFSSFILWTTMIRRRLYREVKTTRFDGLS
jgi:uncharacterized membrane protein